MTVALHGNLRDFGMGEVFQLIGQQRKSGVLQVRGTSAQVELRFDAGCIVAAAPVGAHEHAALGEMLVRCGLLTREQLNALEAEREPSLCSLPQLLVDRSILGVDEITQIADLLTRDTIFDLLRWEDGSFRFDACPVSHSRDRHELLGAEQVLMDGLRMVDEWRTFAEEVPSESIVFRRVGSFESYRRTRVGREPERIAEEERVFLLIDGRASARRVIDLSRLGSFDGIRVLAQLRRMRLIEPMALPQERTASQAGTARVGQGLRRLAATALGLGLLLAMAIATQTERSTPPRPGMPIDAPSLEDARLRFEARLARNLFEAYRASRGRDPESLVELVRWSRARRGALATSRPAPYYYARGERGMILLAPEH